MNTLSRWLVCLTRWSAEHSILVIVVFAILLAGSIAMIRRMTVSGSLQAMLGTDAPAAASLARITSEYRRLDDLFVLATLPPRAPSVGASDQPDQNRLVEFARRLQLAINNSPAAAPLCRNVRYQADPALREFVQTVMLPAGAFYLDDAGFEALLVRLRPEEMRSQIAHNEAAISAPGPAAQAIAKSVVRDPLRLSELIDDRLASATGLGDPDWQESAEFSDDGHSLLIRISGVRPANDLYFSQGFVDAISACAAQANLDGLQIDIGGGYAIGAWASKTIRADDISSTIVTIILVQLFFIVFYRRASAPLLIGGTAGVGIVIAFGVHAIFVSTITPLTAIAAATLAGLGVDYGIHYLSHYQEHRREGLSSVESSAVTIRGVGLALASACLTTLLGFAALWPSRVAMVRDFALLGSLGLLGALITIYTLMPALMALTDRKPRCAAPQLKIGMIASWVVGRPKVWLTTSLLVLAFAAAALANAGGWPALESDLTVMHPRPNPPLDATEVIRRKYSAMGDSVLIEVRSDSPAPGHLVAATHDAVTALRNADDSVLHVTEVLGLSRLLPNPRMIGERQRRLATIDPATTLAAFDDALHDSLFASGAYDDYRRFLQQLIAPSNVPDIADVLKYSSIAEQILPRVAWQGGSAPTSTILVVRLSNDMHDRASRDAAIECLHRVLDGHDGVTVTGTDAVAYELERTIRHDLPRMVAMSMFLVILWLFIVFRQILDVLLSCIPVAFSTIVVLGFVAATGMRLNIVNGVALPLLVGIAVDSGVFFVLLFRHHSSKDHAGAFGVMCAAVIGTTMTNIMGFGSLYWTRTPAVQTLGIISAVGILAGLWGTLFLLLPLLLIRRSRTATASAAAISRHSP